MRQGALPYDSGSRDAALAAGYRKNYYILIAWEINVKVRARASRELLHHTLTRGQHLSKV
jgi:hypothetical protein